ncbi:MAG: hypothetical protein ACRELB_03790 [Polyangiaceae bacterium]
MRTGTTTPPVDVPCARGTLVAGALGAVERLWGDAGLAELRRGLDADARRSLFDDIVLPVAWYPEAHFESCCEVVWATLARRDQAAFFAFVHASVDHLWSRVHRLLISLTTPHVLARRAPAMWRHDHTHGTMDVELREQQGSVRVRGYPYARNGVMARGHTESFRHILGHARVKTVLASHELDDQGTLVVALSWTR